MFSTALEIQGASPVGYYIKILQPKFDEGYEEITKQKTFVVDTPTKEKPNPVQSQNENIYSITFTDRTVLLNNTFILSKPNFNSENENFLEYVIDNENKTISKKDIEDATGKKIKKQFHNTVNDLGFKNEIRKIFFKVSKVSVIFKNSVSESEFDNLGVDREKLAKELSLLDKKESKK